PEREVATASKSDSVADLVPANPTREPSAGTNSRRSRATPGEDARAGGSPGTALRALDAATPPPETSATTAADSAPAAAPAAQGGAGLAWALGEAVIEGEVQFSGVAPAPARLHREADPYCARHNMTDPIVLVANGKLANVWVHVIRGAPDTPTPAAAVEMD